MFDSPTRALLYHLFINLQTDVNEVLWKSMATGNSLILSKPEAYNEAVKQLNLT